MRAASERTNPAGAQMDEIARAAACAGETGIGSAAAGHLVDIWIDSKATATAFAAADPKRRLKWAGPT